MPACRGAGTAGDDRAEYESGITIQHAATTISVEVIRVSTCVEPAWEQDRPTRYGGGRQAALGDDERASA
jgi:hypothetical protein